MIVYRVCSEREIQHLLDDKSFKNVARNYSPNKQINTHNYKPNKKYLHFFKNFDSIFYFNIDENKYLCTYDIPDRILNKSRGLGFYYDRIHMEKLEEVEEYAIEEANLDIDYIVKIQKGLRFIDIEDYILDDYIDGLKTVYRRNTEKIKQKVYKMTRRKD